MSKQNTSCRAMRGVIASTLLGTLGMLPAQAKNGDVIGATLSETVIWDDNVYRLSPEASATQSIGTEQRGDIASNTRLTVDLDKRLGRSNIYGDWSQGIVRYRALKRANYDSSAQRLGWQGDFAAASNWNIRYGRDASRSDFAESQGFTTNVVTTESFAGDTALGFAGGWQLTAGAESRRTSNDATLQQGGDNDTLITRVGTLYRPQSDVYAGFELRRTTREYRTVEWTDTEFATLGRHASSPASRFDWRISTVRQTSGSARATRQTSLRISHDWVVTGASTLRLAAYRERVPGSTSDSNMTQTHGGTMSFSWTPRAKLGFEGSIDYRKRHFDNYRDPATGQLIDRREYLRSASLLANYAADTWLSVQLGTRSDKRDSNHQRFNYDSTSYWLSLSARF